MPVILRRFEERCLAGAWKIEGTTGSILTLGLEEPKPNFFPVSGKRSDPQLPTAYWAVGRLSDSSRNDYMLVSIDPLITGQKYGLGPEDTEQLILSTHLAGTTLYPIREWPCHVYVMRATKGLKLASHFIR